MRPGSQSLFTPSFVMLLKGKIIQLFILRNFLIPSPTQYLLGAKILFGNPFTVACQPEIYVQTDPTA
jgi:hypothetical protein